jgi:perosamine synthetase
MQFIPLMSPDISDKDINAVIDVLKSGMLVQGVNVAKLEHEIAQYIGVKHAIAVSNGTASLHLALLALGIGVGDEVIVPAFSYVATANVVELVGAKCVFVDIDPKTFNLDVNQISRAITSKTRAIIPVHEFGLSAEMDSILKIAKMHDLFVVEDAACALGSEYNGQKVGSFGQFGSFSFHPRKAITSGEGGILTTNDDGLATKVKILRNHGIDASSGSPEFVLAGFNYRMTDFQAALLLSQFKRLNKIIQKRDELAQEYYKLLSDEQLIQLPSVPDGLKHAWQTYHVLLDKKLMQSKLIVDLNNNGIGTNLGAQCIPDQVYYQRKYKLDCMSLFPNAMMAYKNGLALPMYAKLTNEDIMCISKILKGILDEI